jgi:hypothetical protein
MHRWRLLDHFGENWRLAGVAMSSLIGMPRAGAFPSLSETSLAVAKAQGKTRVLEDSNGVSAAVFYALP